MNCLAQFLLSILLVRAFYMNPGRHSNPRPLQLAWGPPHHVVVFHVAVCPGTSRRRSGEISSMSSSRNSAPCCLATPGRWTSPPSCRKASTSFVNTRVGTCLRPSPSGHLLFPVEMPSLSWFIGSLSTARWANGSLVCGRLVNAAMVVALIRFYGPFYGGFTV